MTRPRLADPHRLDYCAAAARYLLAEREAAYPRLVETGKLTQDAADRGLAVMRSVVAQWRWIVDPAAPPLPPFDFTSAIFGAFNGQMVAELDRVATAARQRAARAPDDRDAADLADLCEALAWHQADEAGVARIVSIIDALRSSTIKQKDLAA